MRKLSALICAAALALAAGAYLPPSETRAGIKVEIGSFPQKTERPGKNAFAWPLGVTEVQAGAPRSFPVTLENTGSAPVSGTLEVWMNDDWTVAGPQGALTLAAKEKKTLAFTGTSKPSALNALYPVHARFTPAGVKKEEAPHPIAVFMYKNPQAPNTVEKPRPPVLGKGVFRLDRGFARTSFVQVKGQVTQLPENGSAEAWGGGMTKGTSSAGGKSKPGFTSHPPYRKGAGFLWSDFPLALPDVKPIRLSFSNFLVSNHDQPPSDGVEYKAFVLEEGKAPVEVCGQLVKKILTWSDCEGDLSAWAGKKVTLRLWTGPGPKMNTCCDGGGWGDVKLAIGPQPESPAEADWQARTDAAVAAAEKARTGAAVANGWKLEAGDVTYGAGVAYGARGLIDGVLAFTDGAKTVAFRGFTAKVETGDGSAAPEAKAEIRAEKGTLRIQWSIPGVTRSARGFPRIEFLSVGPATERPVRVYAGFGNVYENPKSFTIHANGFGLSTRHVGADYANGLSVVQAVDVPPDRVVADGDANLFALQAHLDALYTFVPSSKGAFEAGRRFRAVSGYRKSPGHDRLGARMCLDQWSGDYARAAQNLDLAAKYGLGDSIFVKHDWQCWGYDYRLPEIYPPRGDASAFGEMREACRRAGILFCPHDNYTDIYPDCDSYSYDLVVFNLDGTPQKAWFNPGRHALSYRWAPHAFHPWCLRNAKLLKAGYDPDAVFIDVFTAHGPFDYLDRKGNYHTKAETSASWAKGFDLYRQGFGRADTVCVSEAGQDHLVGCADAGQSDHFGGAKVAGAGNFGDCERTPWHDIATHNYYVLFAGGLGGRYQEEGGWHKGGDAELHGYASDDYLSNGIIGGRNPMCDGPFSRNAVKTFWMQHAACAELGAAEFLDLRYEGSIHRQHSFFSDGSEVWINRATNETWTLPNGVVLPSYGYYAKTPKTTSGVVLKDGRRCGFATSAEGAFYDARKPSKGGAWGAVSSVRAAAPLGADGVRLTVDWQTLRALKGFQPFVHICDPGAPQEGIVFQCGLGVTPKMFATPGKYETAIDVRVPAHVKAGTYQVRYGAWNPKEGGRLAIGGACSDGGSRVMGGTITVAKVGGRITGVTWQKDDAEDRRVVRDRLLGVNRAGKPIDFGGVKTDGSFRLVKTAADWTLTPLPYSDGFTAELALPAGVTVADVESVEPQDGAAKPTWRQEGAKLVIAADGLAFAYRVRFSPFRVAESVWPAGLEKAMNTFVGFSTAFDLKAGEKATLKLAAWYSYRVTLNGAFVAFGPARGPKGFFRPDALDLAKQAKVGRNELLVEVAGYNVPNFYLMEQPPFFKAEVEVDGAVRAASRAAGGDFAARLLPRVQKTVRYSFQRTFAECYRLPGAAGAPLALAKAPEPTLIDRVVPYPDYEVTALRATSFADVREDATRKVHAGRELTLPANKKGFFKGYALDEVEINPNFLMQRLVRTNRRAATEAEKGSARVALAAGRSVTCDRGVNDTGFPGARVTVKKPGRLAVTWGEVLKPDGDARAMGGCCDIAVWDFERAGVYDIAAFEPYTMRYIEFNALGGEMELENLHFRSYKNATAKQASFRASDPALVEVFDAASETFRQNAVDVFTDCPSRERAGWNCDAFFTAPVSTLLTGNADLERVFEENQALPAAFEDIPDGMFPMCYPSDHRDKVFIPNWAMWFVIETGEYLERSGDRATVEKLRPRFEKLVKYLQTFRNSDGLLEKLPSWVFVEWSRSNKLVQDVNYPSNMTWADVLDTMDRLYGRPDLAAEAKKVRETVRRQSWTGSWFCDNAVRQKDGTLKLSGECTETCQYYAFFHRVATPETHAALWKTLLTEFGPQRYDPKDRTKLLAHPEIWPSNAFIGNYIRLKLLERAGLGQQILAETKGYFKYMADRTGTLWENDTTSASCNHGFASYAAVLLVKSVLGVEKVDRAAKTVTVRASDVALERCEATLPVPGGAVVYGWTKKDGKTETTFRAPAGWRLVRR